jgi:hypothetical protein
MESRIHLEKASREGRIFFTLEGDLESKFVAIVGYIHISIPHCFLASNSRCAIRLFTVVVKRWSSLRMKKTLRLMQ